MFTSTFENIVVHSILSSEVIGNLTSVSHVRAFQAFVPGNICLICMAYVALHLETSVSECQSLISLTFLFYFGGYVYICSLVDLITFLIC